MNFLARPFLVKHYNYVSAGWEGTVRPFLSAESALIIIGCVPL